MRTVLASSTVLAVVALATLGSCGQRADEGARPAASASASVPTPTTPTPATSASAASSAPAEEATATPAWVHEDPASATLCPQGMVLVDGEYMPSAGHRCVKWISEKHDRCAVYAPPPLKAGKPEHKRFCIDRYEYPNLPGVKPAVMSDWFDAKEACETEDKRLCMATEWTLACEGNEITPYGYGYERRPDLCNIDRPRPVPEPDFEAFSHPRKISAEVDRLDLRIASGEKPQCQSPFGVHDMTGNVDEWTVNEVHFSSLPPGKKEKDRTWISGLKGGYWGPIRARCRPITSSHNPWFRFYQVGFRCCRDPLDGSFRGTKHEKLPERRERPRPKGAPLPWYDRVPTAGR